jgi:hypothetical protein
MSEHQMVKKELAMTQHGVSLTSLEDALRFARAVVSSGLAPKGDSAEAVMVKLQAGAELGFTPMRALAGLVVVNGRLSMQGDMALALIRSKGHKIDVYAEGEGDARSGVCSFERDGGTHDVRFSLADAKKAGLAGKDTYKAYPDDMLIWKAVSRAAKRYFSDVTMGLDVAEHVRDYGRAEVVREEARALPPATPDPLIEALTSEVTEDAVDSAPYPEDIKQERLL